MRLGQLARKYDVSAQQIIDYLEKVAPELDDLHPNSKLDSDTEGLLADQFKVGTEEVSNGATEVEVSTLENDIEEVNESSDSEVVIEVEDPEELEENLETEIQDIKDQPEEKEEKTIETDRLIEMLESEELPADLEDITHIKAPKKELEGLKVLGKIELQEPKAKTEKDSELKEDLDEPKSSSKSKRNGKTGRLSEEEVERRRKRAKKKKADFLMREERRRKHKEEEERKAQRKAHYEQKMKQLNQKTASKKKSKPVQVEEQKSEVPTKPEPKTLFGKMIRWLVDAS